ncbi:hypothetical protein CMUST_00215 [Corynebacterium mustelae]|uniref:Uncharacterized protein n=1 Tax=Corynebacterium mustelae TaxID=571915 RepID=A0A0G3GZX6_9CORY|nr:hypothetical protein [Corynebacterium mustelae]AKK04402.1 hypothetical protein CMUST_00215 [Corynebacterium mustelae]
MRKLRWIDPLVVVVIGFVGFCVLSALIFFDRHPGGVGEAALWLSGFAIVGVILVFVLSLIRSASNAKPLFIYLPGGAILVAFLLGYSLTLDGTGLHPESIRFTAIITAVIAVVTAIVMEVMVRPQQHK